jgi:hypothetical protein
MSPLTNADKKRAQRQREKEAIAKYGGKRISFIAYGDTVTLLELECQKHGFTGQQRIAEVITHIIHLRDERTQSENQ